jgi:hypothetical protein
MDLCIDPHDLDRHTTMLGGGIARFVECHVAAKATILTFHEPGDPTAEHRGMPVEIVRVYTKIHGGVASAGVEAVDLCIDPHDLDRHTTMLGGGIARFVECHVAAKAAEIPEDDADALEALL